MGHLLTGTTELYPLHSKNLKILQKLLPDVSDIRKVGISCPRSFFYFTSWRGRALARSLALALSNKVSLTVTNSTLSKGVRPTDQPTFGFVRRLGPSLLNATLLLPHTRTRPSRTRTIDEGTVANANVARARAHTPHTVRVRGQTDGPTPGPRVEHALASFHFQTVGGRAKRRRCRRKEARKEEERADRDEMFHSGLARSQSIRPIGGDGPGGREGGRMLRGAAGRRWTIGKLK